MSDTGPNPSRGSRTLFQPPESANRFPAKEPTPQFYDCGICGALHWIGWDGDCREDQARFYAEDLDRHYGFNGWEEVSMPGSEDEPTTLAAFIAANELHMTCTQTDHNPNMANSSSMSHWRCTIIRKAGSRMSLVFSMGSGLTGEPNLASVLDCLASDATGTEQSFDEWCSDLGYDTDSRTAERTWKACAKQAKALKRMLGNEAYETLLYRTERL